MKKFFCLLLICLLLCPLLAACGESTETVTLYVYNWGEYMADGTEGSLDVNAEFEKWYEQTYGVRVEINYSTYSSNEDMYTKISSGATKYDVICPSDYMISRMIDEGMLRPLNFDNIPNISYVDYARIFGESAPHYDPTASYSVPYTYGTIGLIWNTTLVDEADIGSWGIMWNEKYEGNILQFNNSRDAFGTALYYLGYSVNTANEAEWSEALELLKTQKPIVQGYVMDEIYNKMENGSAAIAPYYAGDFFTMYEKNEDLAFFYPREGTNFFVDAMCIPTGSQNPEIAEAYINFMLREDVAVANAEYMCYASPHSGVIQNASYISYMEEIHPDAMQILYGTEGIPTEAYENLPEERLMLLNELWEDLKIESTIGAAIIVMALTIVAGLVALAVFFYVRRRRRRRIIADLWKD